MIIFIILISIIFSTICNSQMDMIKFIPSETWSKSNWWIYNNPTKNWLLKIPFAFLLDGWHFMKTLRILSILVPIAYFLSSSFMHFLALEISLYIFEGIVFNLSFYYLRRR